MAKSAQDMGKMTPPSETGKVLLAIKLKEERGASEEVEPVEKPAPKGPTFEDCGVAVKAAFDRFKKKVGGEKVLKDNKDLQAASPEFVELQKTILAALKSKTGKPAQTLDDIARLEPLFQKGWEKYSQEEQARQAKAAKTELTDLKRREGEAAQEKELAFRAAEKAGLFELPKQIAAKLAQVQLLEKNLKDGTFTGKKADYEERVKKAKEEQAALEHKLEKLADAKERHEAAVRAHDALTQEVLEGQKRADDLDQQPAKLEAQVKDLADELGERCKVIEKDSDLPPAIAKALTEAKLAIKQGNYVKAQWALEDLPDLLDAEEKRLREAYEDREDFMAKLDALEDAIEQVAEEELASPKDKDAVAKARAAVLVLAKARRYGDATVKADALARLLDEVDQRIEATRLEQDAFEAALAEALEEIEVYKSGETVVPSEVETMNDLVRRSRLQANFVDALAFVDEKLKPKIEHFKAEQRKWSKVGPKEKPPRTPPAPPNYNDAADRVVKDVLAKFKTTFHYAGPSVDLSVLFPRDRYDPARLKAAVRRRFNALTPSTSLPGLAGPKAYFNLGAGGTTKKAYEYNVKVKKPGEAKALAQIHIVYL